MSAQWANWSGSVRCNPCEIAAPASEDELCELVRRAAQSGRVVRVTGSGHSFTPLCATDEILVSLDNWQGIESADADALEATIRGGTKIHQIGEPLLEAGMALANQGDVDVQSIAGALSTGTHGTGKRLGNLSTRIVGLRLVSADGEVVEYAADSHPEILHAARVSLGALGVISALRLSLVPAYRLHERLLKEPIEACLQQLDERIAANRHFEFFWYPTSDLAHVKILNPTDAPPDELPDRKDERIDDSFRVFPSQRDDRFNEIEYSLPAAAGPECFSEIRSLLKQKYPHVTWPVEYRTLAADDIYLSTASGRETVTISVHQHAELPYVGFFADAEKIFCRYDGRPHWGKIHTLTAEELQELYPCWDEFQAVRQQLDPQGRFLNSHLRSVFGV